MKNNDNKFDVLYIDNNRLFRLLVLYMIIFYVLLYFFSNSIKVSCYLVYICNIILNFGLMLITVPTSKYANNGFFKFSAFCFLFMGLVNIYNFTLYTGSTMNSSYLAHGYGSNIEIQNILQSLYLYLALDTLNENKKNKTNIAVYFSASVFAIFVFKVVFPELKLNIDIGLIFLDSISILVFIYSLIKTSIIYRIKFRKYSEVNYFNISVCIFAASAVFHIISFIDKSPIIMFFYQVMCLSGYVTIYYSLSENLLQKTYSILFDDIYLRNVELEEINRAIFNKNNNMELIRKNLEKREIIFRDLLNNLPMPMFLINDENNRISYVNREAIKMIGISSVKEIINKNIYNLISFNKDSTVATASWKSCEGFLSFNNKEVEVELTRYTLNPKENLAIILAKDITERKKFEKLKKDFEKKQIEHKLQNDFLSTITHDLKTPINVIYSASQLGDYLIKEKDITALNKYNMINKDNCMSLIRLTNNLLDNSQITNDYLKPDMELQNIVEIVEDATLQLIDYARMKNLEIIFDTEDEEVFIYCDSNFMERIILNILSNSIRYSKMGVINVVIKLEGNYVCLEIEDSGKGISKDTLNKIFNKFNSTNIGGSVANKSTGLGLYVVKNLVELQGGEISIESKFNCGTRVTIRFQRESEHV